MSKINRRHNFATAFVKASKDRFKVLFDVVPVALVEGLWGRNFEVLNTNPAALTLFAAKDKQHFSEKFYGSMMKIPHKMLLELLSARVKGDFFEAELRLPTLNHKFVHVFMRLVYMPAKDAVGPQHVVIAFHDITVHKQKENFFKKLSQIDGLTKVLNHRAIAQRLDEEIARARRYELDLTCVMFDLDNFKKTNDTLGHVGGDRCLQATSQALKLCLRKTDIIGRYGGDEFLVILPETKPEQATIPINRFLHHARSHLHFSRKEKTIKASFSIGVSGFPTNGIETARDLVKAADQALYESKTCGGDCFHIYHQLVSPLAHR